MASMSGRNASRWDCALEPTETEDRFAVRLGLHLVHGFADAGAAPLVTARAAEPYAAIDDLWRRAGVPAAALVQLAEAGAFRSPLRLARREALWAIKALLLPKSGRMVRAAGHGQPFGEIPQ
jgi:error-prone DNA polymerase